MQVTKRTSVDIDVTGCHSRLAILTIVLRSPDRAGQSFSPDLLECKNQRCRRVSAISYCKLFHSNEFRLQCDLLVGADCHIGRVSSRSTPADAKVFSVDVEEFGRPR